MTSSLYINLARLAKIAALLVFLLPFVTVSCSPREMATIMGNQSGPAVEAPPAGMPESCVLVQASGLQLALGQASPGSCLGALANMPGETGRQPDMSGPFAQNDYAVIGAAAAILLTLILGFVLKGTAGPILGIVGSLGAIGAVAWSVFMRIPEAVFSSPPQGGNGPPMAAEQARQIIHVDPGIGFWLMVTLLVLAIVLYVVAIGKGKAGALAAPTSS
jgi:hypothetical protein